MAGIDQVGRRRGRGDEPVGDHRDPPGDLRIELFQALAEIGCEALAEIGQAGAATSPIATTGRPVPGALGSVSTSVVAAPYLPDLFTSPGPTRRGPPGGDRLAPAQRRKRDGGRIVKLVIGIVRPEKANDVLEALYRAEVRGVSLSPVQGHGGELDRVETYRGTTVKVGLADKVRFEIAVSDSFVQTTVDALCEGGRTGEVGDGKIFVVPLERAVRIRTGETDETAVTPVGA